MTLHDLTSLINKTIHPGNVFENPGGGTSIIKMLSDGSVSYIRGKSTYYLKYQAIHKSYQNFKGKTVSSSDLRHFMPFVYDSSARPAGHSCNCTFFFSLMQKLELAGTLTGAGVRGNPYAIHLH